MLNWSAQRLADEAGIGVATVRRYEAGATVTDASVIAMAAALCRAGIELIANGSQSRRGGAGVRFKS